MNYYIGIDLGSLTCKVVLINNGKFVDSIISSSSYNFKEVAKKLFSELLKRNNLIKKDIKRIVSTGYGRHSIPKISNKQITEISSQARGIQNSFPDVLSIIDIGGQDSKVIKISNETKKVIDFQMNDKCAAGTGRFLEVMASALNININDFGDLALKSKNPEDISSMCTVFAESEVIGLFAQGANKEDIAAGIHKSIAKRVATMANRINIAPPLVFCGGVALNPAVKFELQKILEIEIKIPKNPQLTAALGAALIAYKDL